MFYDVDGVQGRHYFGDQDYSVDLGIAWSYIQQQLAPYNLHSESYYGQDGIHEQISDGKSYVDLNENVFNRKPSEASQQACRDAFYKGVSIMKNKIYFTLGFTFCAFGFSMILLGVLHNWSI
jgi:hypothetical protein